VIGLKERKRKKERKRERKRKESMISILNNKRR
jgi:hypothetical protein